MQSGPRAKGSDSDQLVSTETLSGFCPAQALARWAPVTQTSHLRAFVPAASPKMSHAVFDQAACNDNNQQHCAQHDCLQEHMAVSRATTMGK